MPRLSIPEIARTWEANGGNPAAVVVACAVALAESGGDTDAISPSNDYGLWQINVIHFKELGVNGVTIRDRDINARAAIRISGNGSNWGAWCTCSVSPHDCGHVYRPTPQPGSVAAMNLGLAAQALNEQPPELGPGPSVDAESSIHYAWNYLTDIVGPFSRQTYQSMASLNAAVRRL